MPKVQFSILITQRNSLIEELKCINDAFLITGNLVARKEEGEKFAAKYIDKNEEDTAKQLFFEKKFFLEEKSDGK